MNEKFSDERISAYLDDELSAEERTLIDRELTDNADLRQAVEELRSLRAGLQALPRYRLETNLAERVLQLAEREVLLGSGTGDKATAATGTSTPALGNGAQVVGRNSESSKTNVSSPAYSLTSPSQSSAHGGRFSWRTFAWSAAAAAAAALVTNYYHLNNPRESGGGSVAVGQNDPAQGAEQTTQANRGEDATRNAPRQDETVRAAPTPDAGAKSIAADAAGNAQAQLTKQTGDAANSGVAVDGPAERRATAMTRGRGGKDRGEIESGELAQGGAPAASALAGSDDDLLKTKFGNGNNNGGGHNNGSGGGIGGQSYGGQSFGGPAENREAEVFVVVDVLPEAWQDRAFDQLLLTNRVVMVDESKPGGTDKDPGEVAMRSVAGNRGRSQPKLPAETHENRRPDGELGDRAGDRAGGGAGGGEMTELSRSDVVVLDVTRQQLDELLAAVSQRHDAFSRAEEYTIAEAETDAAKAAEIAKAQDAQVRGSTANTEAPIAEAPTSEPPSTPRAIADTGIGRSALEKTDSAGKDDKNFRRQGAPDRGFGGRGDPLPASDRPKKETAGNDVAPAGPADVALPEEQSEPPRDIEKGATSEGAAEKGTANRAANSGARGSAGTRRANVADPKDVATRAAPAERKAETKTADENATRHRTADGGGRNEKPKAETREPKDSSVTAAPPAPSRVEDAAPPPPAPADIPENLPRAKPGDVPPAELAPAAPEHVTEEANQEKPEGASPADSSAGYARRIPPRLDLGGRDLAGGRGNRARATEPPAAAVPPVADVLPADAVPADATPAPAAPDSASDAPAPAPEGEPAAGDAPAASTLEDPRPSKQMPAEVMEGASPRFAASSPRVRVIFLLRQAPRGPSALELAAPGDASAPAAPAPNAPPVPPASEVAPAEAAPLPASPR